MLNGYSGIRTRNFGLCLPSLLVGQTMTGQSWTGSLDECPDPQLDFKKKFDWLILPNAANANSLFFSSVDGKWRVSLNCKNSNFLMSSRNLSKKWRSKSFIISIKIRIHSNKYLPSLFSSFLDCISCHFGSFLCAFFIKIIMIFDFDHFDAHAIC